MGPSAKTKTCILVADDDPEILGLLSIRLKKVGYEIIEASDGLQTLAKARARKPDLVILDVMMPGKNGWEVARELKQDEETRGIGIIMLSAIGEKVNEITAKLYGADDHLDKPFEFADLEARIARILKKS
jgi:DNA-binding response OmpR family regulator